MTLATNGNEMDALSPPTTVVLDRALEDPLSAARIRRMLAALGTDLGAVCRARDADIPELIRANGWHGARVRQGRLGPHSHPSLVFSALRFGAQPETAPVLAACPQGTPAGLVKSLLGYGGRTVAKEDVTSTRGVCPRKTELPSNRMR